MHSSNALHESILVTARSCIENSVPVVPIIPGEKSPSIGNWTANPIADGERLFEFKDGYWIGIVCGYGGREVLDFDKPGLFEEYSQLFIDSTPQFKNAFLSLPLVSTPSGGRHLHYRADHEIPGSQKLAMPIEKGSKPFIETRGTGGQVVCPPSPGYQHISGNNLWSCPIIPWEMREALIICAKTFDLRDVPESKPPTVVYEGGGRPGDDYNERGETWDELLMRHGWTKQFNRSEVEYWCRPGKTRGISATLGKTGPYLYVFSTSTALNREGAFNKFSVYAQYEHNGDFKAAAKALASQGFGRKKETATNRTNGDSFDGKEPHEDSEPDVDNEFGIEIPDESNPLAGNSEHNLARHLLQYLEPCIADNGSLYRYRDGIWDEISRQRIEAAFSLYEQGYCKKRREKDGMIYETVTNIVVSTKHRSGCFCTLLTLRTRENFFNDARKGIAFNNGFLTPELEFLPHSPEHKARTKLHYDYKPDAPHDRLDGYLLNLFGEDEDAQEKIETIQEFIGASFFSMAPKMQRAMVWIGGGANGKSTFIDIVNAALFQSGGSAHIDPSLWGQEYYLADLHGVKLNFIGELPDKAFANSGIFKAVISGDFVTARRPTKMPFRFKPIAGHIFSCNKLPESRDMTDGFWRRIMPLQFKANFSPKTEDIVGPILEQSEGIAAWAVKGLKRLLERKCYRPISQELISELRLNADTVQRYFNEKLEITEGYRLSGKEIYADYRRWMEAEGEKNIITNWAFGSRLSAISGVKKVKNSSVSYNLIFK